MTTKEMIAVIAEKTGVTKVKATEFYNTVLGVITTELKDSGEVNIKGIGRLRTKGVAARTARDPRNGKEIDVPAITKVQFKASSVLKEAVQ